MAQTKREFIKATFIAESSNALNMAGEKEQVNRIVLIDKKTEREVLDTGFYMARGRNAQTVYCSIWVHTKDGKEHSGHGKAGGGGYHKESAALADAIASAGISLWGDQYNRTKTPKDTKAHISGCGERAMHDACNAIAYAAGYRDCISA